MGCGVAEAEGLAAEAEAEGLSVEAEAEGLGAGGCDVASSGGGVAQVHAA